MTIMEKLGFPKRVPKLTKKICKDRLKELSEKIDAGKFKGERLELAQYYVYKYRWMIKAKF